MSILFIYAPKCEIPESLTEEYEFELYVDEILSEFYYASHEIEFFQSCDVLYNISALGYYVSNNLQNVRSAYEHKSYVESICEICGSTIRSDRMLAHMRYSHQRNAIRSKPMPIEREERICQCGFPTMYGANYCYSCNPE